MPGGRRLDLLTQPEKWMDARLAQLTKTHLVGDALPSIRVDYGPVCLGMLMGAPVEFVSDSTWTHSFIRDDWSNAPDWKIHTDNPRWQLLPRLLQLNAENARGRYIAMTPNLGATADLLLNTRGADLLCMDLIGQPEKIGPAVEKIHDAWRPAYQAIWEILMDLGVGAINFVGLWSDQPYHVLECDFNYMIGPRPFRSHFLPEITRQAAAVGRSIFHVDGPRSRPAYPGFAGYARDQRHPIRHRRRKLCPHPSRHAENHPEARVPAAGRRPERRKRWY